MEDGNDIVMGEGLIFLTERAGDEVLWTSKAKLSGKKIKDEPGLRRNPLNHRIPCCDGHAFLGVHSRIFPGPVETIGQLNIEHIVPSKVGLVDSDNLPKRRSHIRC